ncbi:hypothetical protein DFQ28_011250 [Apophysomyces sp. BC1034]|nr:hypothetical protein DFQ28_011250 [Apophysomyces sp. BC1034]
MSAGEPSQTLYLYNLSELKRSLYHLFITYGEILDIVAMSSEKMREQAFVVYDNVASATAAMRSLNGFTFHDRPMSVEYARTKSHAVAKLDGTYRLKSLENKDKNNVTTLGKRANTAEHTEGVTKVAKSEDGEDEEGNDEEAKDDESKDE